MVLDGRFRFIVRMDGVIEQVNTGSDYTSYYTTFSNGVISGDTFEIHTRYMQTAFQAIMWITKTDTGVK